ncbi:hypothetical protein [Streptomyces sp. NPDC055692]|uniref:hypothetical protein n=1 Tax=Streptomyces sp. NPDC055692 TaxID=3155683 RepID=UPI00341C1B30
MKELEAIRQQLQRLDDPTVGLTALHGEVTQSCLKILELIQGASPDYARRTGRYAGARTG